jgi:hypothetical protein
MGVKRDFDLCAFVRDRHRKELGVGIVINKERIPDRSDYEYIVRFENDPIDQPGRRYYGTSRLAPDKGPPASVLQIL